MAWKDLFKTFVNELQDSFRGTLNDAIRGQLEQLAHEHRTRIAATRGGIARITDRFDAMSDPDERGVISGFRLKGGWHYETYAPFQPEEMVAFGDIPNMVTNAALNDVLSVYLAAGTQKTVWYGGIINNSPAPSLAAADTMSSHAGWAELTAYTAGVRQTWTPSAPSGQSITNPTSMTFTINATVSAYGCFLASDSTKSGTTGILFATGAFSAVQSLVNGQNLKVTYTCPASAT